MKCVVMEPSPTIRRIIQNSLLSAGIEEIVLESNPQGAIERCDVGTALVITSWSPEGDDGIELTKRLRTNPDTAAIPVLMVTERNARDEITAARDAGVTSYLLKPFAGGSLHHRIDEILNAAGSASGAAGTPESLDAPTEKAA